MYTQSTERDGRSQHRATLRCMTGSLPELPEIPPEVYESRDRGDLVLFCGAGVSKNAGCPLFSELATLVKVAHGSSDPLEDRAHTDGQFDVYLQLVEQRLDEIASEGTLRKFVQKKLTRRPNRTSVHQSILKLARTREGVTRLVTTNYDNHFRRAARKLQLGSIRFEYAPRIAKPSREKWNSVVHLHGGLDGGDLRDLVLTSGDFGRAYITERWAGRFVTELFENFDVLFLGYRAEDVVIRYLLDAYAAQPAGNRKNVWAIAAPEANENVTHWRQRWERRRVNLISYDPRDGHKAFVDALADWVAIVDSPASRREQVARILDSGVPNLSVGNRRNQLEWLLGDSAGEGARALVTEREDNALGGSDGHHRKVDVPTGSAEWLDTFLEMELLAQHAWRLHTKEKGTLSATTPLVGAALDRLELGDRASTFARWLSVLAVSMERVPGGRPNSEVLLDWIQRSPRKAALHPELVSLIRTRMSDEAEPLTPELRESWQSVLDLRVNGGQLARLPTRTRTLDIVGASAEELAKLMVNKTDFTTREGRAAGELEVLVQRGESKRLLEVVACALAMYVPGSNEDIAGGVVSDPFPDRAARYLLAIAEHEKKSEQEREISTDELMALWDKLEPVAMAVEHDGMPDSSRAEVTKALNHPAGKLAQALFAILLPKSVQYRSSLNKQLKQRVERNVTKPGGAGRAFLAIAASRLYVLHYAEPKWTADVLVSHFDWKDETRARTSWQGYLWAPQLNADLYAQLRNAFLDTFERADQLGEFAESLCGLLVSLALDGGDVLQRADTSRALREMPADLRVTVVWQLCRRLENAQGRAAELARTRIVPWLRGWQVDTEVWRDAKLADELTQFAIACEDAVNEATSFIVEQPDLKLGRWPFSLHALLTDHQGLFAEHSRDIARLFDHVLPSREENLKLGGQVWSSTDLQALIDKLRDADQAGNVTNMPEFKHLEAQL